MSDLLELVLEAHGGLDTLRSVREIKAHVLGGGLALVAKGAAGRFRDYRITADTDRPRSVLDPYPRDGTRGVFDGARVWLESETGERSEERDDPRSAFRNPRRLVWWDPLDSLYFAGYAMWNYLNTPLVLTRPDVQLREGDAWEEDGERWRRLEASFPEDFPTHSREQTFYFDPQGLLRRHDYTAEVFGSFARAAHYCTEHRRFDGLVFPTRRRVHPRKRSNHPRRGVTLVRIDIDDLEVSRR